MSVMNQRPDKALFEDVATLRQILPAVVEKDWFVTQIIGVAADIHVPGFEIVFTGGTALSKAHGLLERFSEDIDFRVIVAEEHSSRAALSSFKKLVIQALRDGGFNIEDANVRARDENRFFAIDLEYQTYFEQAQALRPHIQIEVSVRATQLPQIYLPVGSFVNASSNMPPEVARIGCVDPVESAADKLSALAWRVPDRIRGGNYDDPSLVRHIHDLALLKSRALGHRDFFTLVMAAMQTDAARPKNKPELETMPPTEKLQLMLQILSDDKQYAPEYERFVGGVSYATADKIPHFGTALAAVRELVSVV